MAFELDKAFDQLDQVINTIQANEHNTYLESFIHVLRYINTEEGITEVDTATQDQLKQALTLFDAKEVTSEDKRKVIQLAILKAMKGSTQQQHMVTPDSVAMFIGYFINKLMEGKKQFRLFDPASGTANLLTAVMNQAEAEVTGYGSEVDPDLIQLAVESANLQEKPIEFFHQDSLTPFLLEPVDAVISDLPVGYYPNDEQAAKYELNAEEGHAYAHHLFIEQSVTYTKPSGYLIFLIPNFLFTSDQGDQLQKYLRHHAHILSLLQLPLSMFASEQHAKSILVLQKKGTDTKPPKQTLMAQLPSFKDVHATHNILKKIDHWFQTEKDK
ncbi:class I SAM-dependent methyltransferase [Gracilibacillus sp. YIM 98692]|uniref:class I SAM-dependent methyltransferase n=1 Tax=Gracilibacillus sp. YIM 98692 TaxID=2663532 RepID=UPI0013D64591|nr:class I SAM-dependent methyltransferase [Gracilibacillus sp. YIM 98692]